MKFTQQHKRFVLLLMIVVGFHNTGSAQKKDFKQIGSTEPIAVSDIKTTHLILNDKIKYLDIGSRYFVTDTLENIVKVKHIGGDFTKKEEEKKTNLTIITKDGSFYSIPLFFLREITNTTYRLNPNGSKSNISMKPDRKKMGKFEMCHFTQKAVSNYNIKGNRDLLFTKVSGIFYRGNYISIRVEVKNFSTIDLNIDHFLFRFVKDKRFARDAVYQERVLRPVLICNESDRVRGTGGIEVFSFVFEKFVPNDNEKLQMDIIEKDGGRSTTIKIPRKKLLKPQVI